MNTKRQNDTIRCNDGFSMSVQASKTHYCVPRNNTGPYCSVEVGMPSSKEQLLMPYAEDPENPTGSVYGYVPSETVWDTIIKHGGHAGGELPPLFYGDTNG